MRCKGCGESISASAHFCSNCGTEQDVRQSDSVTEPVIEGKRATCRGWLSGLPEAKWGALAVILFAAFFISISMFPIILIGLIPGIFLLTDFKGGRSRLIRSRLWTRVPWFGKHSPVLAGVAVLAWTCTTSVFGYSHYRAGVDRDARDAVGTRTAIAMTYANDTATAQARLTETAVAHVHQTATAYARRTQVVRDHIRATVQARVQVRAQKTRVVLALTAIPRKTAAAIESARKAAATARANTQATSQAQAAARVLAADRAYVQAVLPVMAAMMAGNSLLSEAGTAGGKLDFGTARQDTDAALVKLEAARTTLHGIPNPPSMTEEDRLLNLALDNYIAGAQQVSVGLTDLNPDEIRAGADTYQQGTAAIHQAVAELRRRGYHA